jgi:hypothetical protein
MAPRLLAPTTTADECAALEMAARRACFQRALGAKE